MAGKYTYPGVYVEEVPSEVRTITGVSTSVTAFVGYTPRGPTSKPVKVFNFGEYERKFGGLHSDSDVSYAVQQFFQNGGSEAWVVRVARGAAKAGIALLNLVTGGQPVLEVEAVSEGSWGNGLRLDVDYKTENPDSLFSLTVIEYTERDGMLEATRTETHSNLSMNQFSNNYAVEKINANSDLVRVRRKETALAVISAQSGTSVSGHLTDALGQLGDDCCRLAITINGDGPHEFDIFEAGMSLDGADVNDVNRQISDLARRIKEEVWDLKPADDPFSGFDCRKVNNADQIIATSGVAGENSSVHFSSASKRNAASVLKLGVSNGGREEDAVALIRPAQTGCVGGDISALNFDDGDLSSAGSVSLRVNMLTRTLATLPLNVWTSTNTPTSLEELRDRLEAALHGASETALRQARVTLISNRLRVIPGGTDPNVYLMFADRDSDTAATDMGLTAAASNVALYALGVGKTFGAQAAPIPGDDGQKPDDNDLKGSRSEKKGLYALEDADLFNIMCIPNNSSSAVLAEATVYCEERRALLLIDLPGNVDDRAEAKQWLVDNASLRHKNTAAYFPRIKIPDPLQNFRLRPFPACGAVAGLFARTDSERGVWKAPAGTDAVLRGIQKPTYPLTNQETGDLNKEGLNCLRTFPVYGNVVWGARTLMGADEKASEWKYIPVRRTALYIEESLYRGTQWVVFEPNDEPLWAQIRLNIGAFMHSLFRRGAFQGTTPREAYFVKCDKETTTQDDINRGIVNILVGFAPLKPAEFVVIKISQIAGQIQT